MLNNKAMIRARVHGRHSSTAATQRVALKRFLYCNGLSLALTGLFLLFLGGQTAAGFVVYNDDRQAHGQPQISYGTYLLSSHCTEAVFENWESEFLQMGAYVLLTVVLVQRGSAESRPPKKPVPARSKPSRARVSWRRRIYENSLGLAFGLLFLGSFLGHAFAGAAYYNEQRGLLGEPPIPTIAYFGTAQFWFESFQNWQSEFLAIGSMVILSIFLRQKGSPESKPVDAPNSATGA